MYSQYTCSVDHTVNRTVVHKCWLYMCCQVSKGSPSWKAYVDYVSDLAIDGFAAAIVASVHFLIAQLDCEQIVKNDTGPLLEIQLELVAPDIIWKPELSEGPNRVGVRDMVQHWLMSFLEVGGLMKRLDTGEGSYAKELEENYDVYDAMGEVCTAQSSCSGCNMHSIGQFAPQTCMTSSIFVCNMVQVCFSFVVVWVIRMTSISCHH